jgi:signal peptidase I
METAEPFAEQNATASSGPKKRRLLAAILSCVVPGLGQFLLRQKLAGAISLAAFCALIFLHWPVRLGTSYWGMIFLVWGAIALFVGSGWDALRARSTVAPAASRVWLLPVIPLALLMCNEESALFLRASGLRMFQIPSTSMERTIMKGDRIVADLRDRMQRRPSRGDLIVFRRENTWYLKRVIATGGDTISGRNNLITLNGSVLNEPYVQHIGNAPPELITFGPVTVPPGQFFVMGDNRDVSFDSREANYGPVDESSVFGQAIYIAYSPKNGFRGSPRIP